MPGRAPHRTQSRTVRLTVEEWAELDYAASVRGRTRNDEVRWRLAQHRVVMPPPGPLEGQLSLADCGQDRKPRPPET